MIERLAEICTRCDGTGLKDRNTIIVSCIYCKGEGLISPIKCVNYDCPKANTCFRMLSEIDNYWQGFNHYDENNCKYYIKATDEDIQKAVQINAINTRGTLSRHWFVVQHGRQEGKRELYY